MFSWKHLGITVGVLLFGWWGAKWYRRQASGAHKKVSDCLHRTNVLYHSLAPPPPSRQPSVLRLCFSLAPYPTCIAPTFPDVTARPSYSHLAACKLRPLGVSQTQPQGGFLQNRPP